MKRSWIEKFAEGIGVIPKISHHEDASEAYALEGPRPLYKYPSPDDGDSLRIFGFSHLLYQYRPTDHRLIHN